MKIKTIQHINLVRMEELVNEFESNHSVKAMQSHVTPFGDNILYTAVIFYVQ